MKFKRPKSETKAIFISWHKPKGREERAHFGITDTDKRIATIYIDITQSPAEMVDTFFHEMAHVFFAFHNHNVPSSREETLAQKVGRICAEVLR